MKWTLLLVTFIYSALSQTEDIDTQISTFLEKNHMPGMVVMIVQNKETVLHKAYGYSDMEAKIPMKKNAIFRLHSMTKPLTSLAFLKFTHQRNIHLDTPLQHFFPLFNKKTDIPLHTILTHTSGFGYGFSIRRWAGYRYLFSGIGSSETLPEFMETLSGLPLFFEPDVRWRYSYSTDVLGAIIQKVEATPFDDYMAQHLFTPLKMNSTGFFVPKEEKERLVPMYGNDLFSDIPSKLTFEEDSELFEKPKGASGGGGGFSTAEDYMKFLRYLMYPEDYPSLVPSSMTKEMLKDQISHIEIGVPERYYPNSGFGYGVGVKKANEAYLSKGSFYWAGKGGTTFWVDPSKNLAVVAMMQMKGAREDLEEALIPIVYQWLKKRKNTKLTSVTN